MGIQIFDLFSSRGDASLKEDHSFMYFFCLTFILSIPFSPVNDERVFSPELVEQQLTSQMTGPSKVLQIKMFKIP